MKYLVCAVRDVAVNAFALPFYVRSIEEARRMFGDACSDPKNEFYKHLKDYDLWLLGEWDDIGKLTGYEKEERICSASDFMVTMAS